MKYLALLALAATAEARHHHPLPRRLDTTLIRFVDDAAHYQGDDELVRDLGSRGVFIDVKKYEGDGQGGQRNFEGHGDTGLVTKYVKDKPFDSSKPFQWNFVQSKFIEQNDEDFNDELAKYNQIKKLGDHGYLVDAHESTKVFAVKKPIADAEELRSFLHSVEEDGEVADEQMEEEAKAAAEEQVKKP